jgi:biotin synthase
LPDGLIPAFYLRVIERSFSPAPEYLQAAGPAQQALHARASNCTSERFGNQVFVRAVVEVSNFCRENCVYCGMRRENRALGRFRARLEQLAGLLIEDRPASITDINIQSGEDPVVVRDLVLPLVKMLRKETTLGISVCLGTLERDLYTRLKAAGATIYIIKFESADEDLYTQLQAPGTLDERVAQIHQLAAEGWQVSSGFIAGLPGQNEESLIANFELARRLPLAGCSVSPFIPGESTPLASYGGGDIDVTLNCMAMLRLMRPDWVIPAVSALNLADPGEGYRRGLRAGANLVTINMTPSEIRGDYLLYKRDRFIMTEERILHALAAEGLAASEQSLADFYESVGQSAVS